MTAPDRPSTADDVRGVLSVVAAQTMWRQLTQRQRSLLLACKGDSDPTAVGLHPRTWSSLRARGLVKPAHRSQLARPLSERLTPLGRALVTYGQPPRKDTT